MGRVLGSKNKRTIQLEQQIERLKRRAEQGLPLYTGTGSNHNVLSAQDIQGVLALAQKGLKQVDIAAAFNVHQSTVSRVMQLFADTREIAKQRLRAAALPLAEMAIKGAEVASATGDVAPALELLDRTDVAPKRIPAGQGAPGTMIQVVVGSPTPAALPAALRASSPVLEGTIEGA